jgi:soluble lytic murein transglycosylase-like protein
MAAAPLGLFGTPQPALGMRHGGERRNSERRSHDRGSTGRRRCDRRRAKLRSVLFAAATFTIPHQIKQASSIKPVLDLPGPRVTASIESFEAVAPWRAYDGLIREAAALYHLDPVLIRSVMRTESAFDPFAVSRAGALGLMQLMPAVADAFGVENPFDPRENIMAGARLLRELLDQHHGNLALTLASYNAGPGAVASHGGAVPPFTETRNYVKRVTHLIADAHNAGSD